MFMSEPSEMNARHGRILAELAELGLGLARELQAQALAAETPAERAEAALAFQRVGRAVRQSIALEAKLERDRARDAREAADDRARTAEDRTARRKREAKLAVRQAVWRQAGRNLQAEHLMKDLDDTIELEACKDEFIDDPVEAVVERLCRLIGVISPARLDARDARVAAGLPPYPTLDEIAASASRPPGGGAPGPEPRGPDPPA
jgi:hypothetical protein